tara:strand:+ start:561 stop:1562 length:1002 start_codon:yes stop_codon:yes gene_type:complete
VIELNSRLRNLFDALLEFFVITSFSNIGYIVRHRLFKWSEFANKSFDGKCILITGSTSGIGLRLAEYLASKDAKLILIGRDSKKTNSVVDDLIEKTNNTDISFFIADMGNLEDVRRMATKIKNQYNSLDILVHNAGSVVNIPSTSPQGIETTVASQLIGPFLLTNLMLGLLKNSNDPRVITVSSGGMYTEPLNVNSLNEQSSLSDKNQPYNGLKRYAVVKRAQVSINSIWAERIIDERIKFYCMHPGWVTTPGLELHMPTFSRYLRLLLRNLDQGIDTLLWLISSSESSLTSSGDFWHDRKIRTSHRLKSTKVAETNDERTKLWNFCVEKMNY